MFREKKQIIILSAAVLMLAGFVFFGCLPLRKKMQVLKIAEVSQKAALQRSVIRSRQLPGLEKQLQQMQEQFGNYKAALPCERQLGEFLKKIANLMNEHNLAGQCVEPAEEVKLDELNCIPVNMQCSGTLKQIFDFYNSLKTLDRLIRIEEVKLVNDKDFSGLIRMQTKIAVYYRSKKQQS